MTVSIATATKTLASYSPVSNTYSPGWTRFFAITSVFFSCITLAEFHSVKTEYNKLSSISNRTQAEEKKFSEKKWELVYKGGWLVGSIAYSLVFGEYAKWFSLGPFGPWLNSIAVLAMGFSEGIQGIGNYREFKLQRDKESHAVNPAEKEAAARQKNLASIQLIGRICCVAWSILHVASMAMGATILPLITESLLILSLVLWIVAYVYKNTFESKEPERAAAAQ